MVIYLSTMKQLILTSSSNVVVNHWIKQLDRGPKKLSLAFITTAAECYSGEKPWIEADKNALITAGFKLIDYTITGKTLVKLKQDLANVDLIFVAGGNTFYLLDQAYRSGFFQLLQSEKWQDKVYVGSSAGSLLVCPDINVTKYIDDPTVAPNLKSTQGAGLVPFVVLPHWGATEFQKEYQQLFNAGYDIPFPLVMLRDNQYLLVENNSTQFFQQ